MEETLAIFSIITQVMRCDSIWKSFVLLYDSDWDLFWFLILPQKCFTLCSIMFIQNCKNFRPSKKLIPGTNILPHPLFPRPGYARLPGQRYNYYRHNCYHYHQHHHDDRRLSRHLHNHHCICCHHPHLHHPDLNQITCGGWDTERRGSGVRRRLPALSTLKKDDVYVHADDGHNVVGSDDNREGDDHVVADERNLQGWAWLPSQITWGNWTDREGTPIS